MRIFQKLPLVLVVCLLITFSSCNNNDNETPEPEPTTEELLMGSWLTTKVEVRTNGVTTDFTDILEPCDADDLMIFEEDEVFKFDEGAMKCYPEDPQTTTGSWRLTSNEKKLTIIEDGFEQEFTIIRISNTELKMSIVEDFTGNGEEDIITATMTKQ